jgi:hypothetical protein
MNAQLCGKHGQFFVRVYSQHGQTRRLLVQSRMFSDWDDALDWAIAWDKSERK